MVFEHRGCQVMDGVSVEYVFIHGKRPEMGGRFVCEDCFHFGRRVLDGEFVRMCKYEKAVDRDLDAADVEPVFQEVDFPVDFDVRIAHRFAVSVLEHSNELGWVRLDDRFVFVVFHFDDGDR